MYPIPRDWLSDKRVVFWGMIGVAVLLDLGTWSVRSASRARLMDLRACGNMLRSVQGICTSGGVSAEALRDARSNAVWASVWFWALTAAIVLAIVVWEVCRHTSWGSRLYRHYCAVCDLLALNLGSGERFDEEYCGLVEQYSPKE